MFSLAEGDNMHMHKQKRGAQDAALGIKTEMVLYSLNIFEKKHNSDCSLAECIIELAVISGLTKHPISPLDQNISFKNKTIRLHLQITNTVG